MNCPYMSIKLEEKLNFCKYDLDEKDRMLTKLSGDVDQTLRNSFSQPNHLNSVNDVQTKASDSLTDVGQWSSEFCKYDTHLNTDNEESKKLWRNFNRLDIQDQSTLILSKEIPHQFVSYEQEKMKRAEESFRGSLNHIADQQHTIEQLNIDNECAKRYAMEAEERYKNLVDWMHVIVTSTKPPSSTQEEFDLSSDAVQRLKTEIASSITQSRENAVLIEELKGDISSKDLQISHLRRVISQLTASGIRRLDDNPEEAQRECEAMNATRMENNALKKRLNCLELQLEEARNQLSHYEENSSREKINALKANINFRQLLSDLLNRSAWICSDSEEEIIEVVRRVLTALTNKAEACSRLQVKLSELANHLAESERKLEHLENELLTLRAKQCRSPTKSVEFLNRTTDLEDSHERLLQFLKQLENRLPIDRSVFDQMNVTDRRNFILDYVSKACAPSPAKSESELAPRLHKRVQRLQDDLVSRELQLKNWQNKVAKLEEQLVLARKGEAEAVEKQALAEQRAIRLRKNEMETKRLKDEASQLKLQLKDSRDAKERLEERTQRVLHLEESVRNLEELRLRQANRIGELVTNLETEKATMAKKLMQQEEEQRTRFNMELREVNQVLDELRVESEELRNFRDIVGRLLGMRVDDLDEPSKEILHGVERLLKESGRNSLHRSITFVPRSTLPRRVTRGSSARMGSTHAFSDSEPATTLKERAFGPMQHTETSHARSSLRTSIPPPAPSSRRPPSPTSTTSSSSKPLNEDQPPSPRDTRRY